MVDTGASLWISKQRFRLPEYRILCLWFWGAYLYFLCTRHYDAKHAISDFIHAVIVSITTWFVKWHSKTKCWRTYKHDLAFQIDKKSPWYPRLNTSRGDSESRNHGKVPGVEGWEGETVRFAKIPGHWFGIPESAFLIYGNTTKLKSSASTYKVAIRTFDGPVIRWSNLYL